MKMSKLRQIFVAIIIAGLLFSGLFTNQISAAVPACESNKFGNLEITNPTSGAFYDGDAVSITVKGRWPTNGSYSLTNQKNVLATGTPDGDTITFNFVVNNLVLHRDSQKLIFELIGGGFPDAFNGCFLHSKISYNDSSHSCSKITIAQNRNHANPGLPQSCVWNDKNGCLETGGTGIYVYATGVKENGKLYNGRVKVKVAQGPSNKNQDTDVLNGNTSVVGFEDLAAGMYSVSIESTGNNLGDWCSRTIRISEAGICGNSCTSFEEDNPQPEPETSGEDVFYLCNQLPEGSESQRKCIQCATGGGAENPGDDSSRRGIWTAIGCIKREPENIAATVIQVGLTVGGGVALLLILAAGFLITTSQGDPKKVSDAKELVVAAITGLLFVIFSVVILQFIGYSVFKIPGFGG